MDVSLHWACQHLLRCFPLKVWSQHIPVLKNVSNGITVMCFESCLLSALSHLLAHCTLLSCSHLPANVRFAPVGVAFLAYRPLVNTANLLPVSSSVTNKWREQRCVVFLFDAFFCAFGNFTAWSRCTWTHANEPYQRQRTKKNLNWINATLCARKRADNLTWLEKWTLVFEKRPAFNSVVLARDKANSVAMGPWRRSGLLIPCHLQSPHIWQGTQAHKDLVRTHPCET